MLSVATSCLPKRIFFSLPHTVTHFLNSFPRAFEHNATRVYTQFAKYNLKQKPKKMATKKAANKNGKRGPKAKEVVEEKPEKEVEASEEEESDEEENASSSEAEGVAAGAVDSEAEEDDDDDEDDNDNNDDEDEDEDEEDDEDEVEPGQVSKSKAVAKESDDEDADSDNEAPVEEPISKQTKIKDRHNKDGGIPRVPVGRIPNETPKDQIVFVSKIPVEYKHVDLVALFVKFGPILVINRVKTKAGGNNIVIAFETAEGAAAALAATDKALTLNKQVLKVSHPLNKDEMNERTIVVGLIGNETNKNHITEHFKDCGEIEAINFSNNRFLPTAFVRFASKKSLEEALKLHGSECNSRFITVRKESYKTASIKSPSCTLTVANTGSHESYKASLLEKIFKKHGELVDLDVVCTRAILAFATYKTSEQAEKTKKQLNGKTIDGLEIKLEPFSYGSFARTILVTNLANGVNEEQLRTLFSECGEIESIKVLSHKATIQFTTDDGFCKSFLFNERQIQGQPIFIEPNSALKHKMLLKKGPKRGKRSFKSGGYRGASQDEAPGQFKKFGNYNNKPFNKRPAQENGSTPNAFKKARKV